MQPHQLMDIATTAKVLKTKQHQLIAALHQRNVLHKSGELKNIPLSDYIERGLFVTVIGTYRQHGIDRFYTRALVTPTGLSFLQGIINDRNDLEARDGLDRNGIAMVHSEQYRSSSSQSVSAIRDDIHRMVGLEDSNRHIQ